MLDHLSIAVSNLQRSLTFYDACLGALRDERVWSAGDAAGYGIAGKDEQFAIKHQTDRVIAPARRSHIAFRASSRDAVRIFHRIALGLGAMTTANRKCPRSTVRGGAA